MKAAGGRARHRRGAHHGGRRRRRQRGGGRGRRHCRRRDQQEAGDGRRREGQHRRVSSERGFAWRYDACSPSCAGNISPTPQRDSEAATMHAFKRSSSHPPPMDASGTMGRGWLSFPSKGGGWETSWGTRESEGGEGVGSAMLIFYVFFGGGRCFLVVRCGREREN